MKRKIVLFLHLIILLVVLSLFYLSIGSPITFLKFLVRATEEIKPKTINSLTWFKINDEEKALQILLEDKYTESKYNYPKEHKGFLFVIEGKLYDVRPGTFMGGGPIICH